MTTSNDPYFYYIKDAEFYLIVIKHKSDGWWMMHVMEGSNPVMDGPYDHKPRVRSDEHYTMVRSLDLNTMKQIQRIAKKQTHDMKWHLGLEIRDVFDEKHGAKFHSARRDGQNYVILSKSRVYVLIATYTIYQGNNPYLDALGLKIGEYRSHRHYLYVPDLEELGLTIEDYTLSNYPGEEITREEVEKFIDAQMELRYAEYVAEVRKFIFDNEQKKDVKI